MPLYEYQCDACEHRFEVIVKFSDPPVEKCPVCGGAVHKLVSSPAFQFKGTGWYVTDYAKKDGGAPKAGASSGESGSEKSEKAEGADSKEKDGKEKKETKDKSDTSEKSSTTSDKTSTSTSAASTAAPSKSSPNKES